ncbi:palmitoleoyl-protein carboxylesterase notum1-like isoform X2 [Ptychodera flava]|uniref:palmitoleoyl-protein carboxylesterase notum1-like isoform X2 n=1 Tax=Ptychodera flava TaxID=63121 RepID=UPI00396A46CB
MHSIWFFLTALLISMTSSMSANHRGSSNEYVLDLKMMDDPEKVMTQIKYLATALHGCGFEAELPTMTLKYLQNTSVTCNDGSPAGYYLRKSFGSKRWLIFLEGGWYCFDDGSCNSRWQSTQSLMSSKGWSAERTGSGLLSADPEENPNWWNANTVFIPYCTSDVWSGASAAANRGEFSFMGSLVVEEVIRELMPHGLIVANKVLLAGSSAGGTGVLINLDKVTDMLRAAGSLAQIRGLCDSGWFLDSVNHGKHQCTNTLSCSPTEAIKRGIKLWNGQIPDRCKVAHSAEEQWNCFFGYKIYPTLQTPVFIFQWLFDEAQLTVDFMGPPVHLEHWNYMQRLGRQLRQSLKNVSAVYAPACYSHIAITKREWLDIHVKGQSLPRALECWMNSDEEQNHPSSSSDDDDGELVHPLSPQSRQHRERTTEADFHEKHRYRVHHNQCHHHLIDNAPCPQCNPTCPKLLNPLTQEEMEFLPFLKLMGFDLSGLARQLGLDTQSLALMDPNIVMEMMNRNK